MIYLIDDNINNKRVIELGISFVDDKSFTDILIPISTLKKDEDISYLKKASCLLVHKTTNDSDANGYFLENSNSKAIEIIETISDYGKFVPLVIFSNRMDEIAEYNHDVNPRCIYQIKKNTFYDRLFDFLIKYRETKEIELRIIAYGKNYKVVEISRYAKMLLNDIAGKEKNMSFNLKDIKISTLEKFHQLADIEMSYKDLLIFLEDNPIKISKFIDNLSLIIESVNKYGKNIYNWPK